jgi:hypothetical protein
MPDDRFISSGSISPFDVDKYKGGNPQRLFVNKSFYYEWNAIANVWAKLTEDEPEPPTNLPIGKFDGQIIELTEDEITPRSVETSSIIVDK